MTDGSSDPRSVDPTASPDRLDADAFFDAVATLERPVLTAATFARLTDRPQAEAVDALEALAEAGTIDRLEVEDRVVYYPAEWRQLAERERLVVFPDRREVIADQPAQFTQAQLSQFAHLTDTNRAGGYRYEIREADVWQAPYDDLADLLATVRAVLPERAPGLEDWIADQWRRAHRFILRTHEDGYVVLEAASESLMGNVARQQLDDGQLRAPISETESWVNEDAIAEVKRVLYEAGYPVEDRRDLETGEPLEIELDLALRDYQRNWVERFMEKRAGVLVGPPGSGKTVAAMGIIERIGGETLILVPSRELVTQWRDQLLAHTSLTEEQIGEYHGGRKELGPVTISTYQTAGMDRHRQLFDRREWGLIVYDEGHHVPAPIHRRSADLQTKHRLALTATPLRESDDEEEIFTLIGPPIGTDWGALFEAGFVQYPEVELRYVAWGSDDARNHYVGAGGHERRQAAAMNPAKIDETRRLLETHREDQVLIFVEYIEQGERFADVLDVPFISGEMRHARREHLLEAFRAGDRDVLVLSRVGDEGIDLPDADVAIVASGLGGSRRQGTQRAGRTMRPAGRSTVYVLATRGTEEEEFARRRLQHLQGKGIRVREVDADGDPDATADPAAD